MMALAKNAQNQSVMKNKKIAKVQVTDAIGYAYKYRR